MIFPFLPTACPRCGEEINIYQFRDHVELACLNCKTLFNLTVGGNIMGEPLGVIFRNGMWTPYSLHQMKNLFRKGYLQ